MLIRKFKPEIREIMNHRGFEVKILKENPTNNTLKIMAEHYDENEGLTQAVNIFIANPQYNKVDIDINGLFLLDCEIHRTRLNFGTTLFYAKKVVLGYQDDGENDFIIITQGVDDISEQTRSDSDNQHHEEVQENNNQNEGWEGN